MWAPADLFAGPVNMMLLPMRRCFTFFYERPLVLVLVLVGCGGVIAVAEAWKR